MKLKTWFNAAAQHTAKVIWNYPPTQRGYGCITYNGNNRNEGTHSSLGSTTVTQLMFQSVYFDDLYMFGIY